MTAIYKRELYSFFTTPLGYIYVAMFWAVSAFVFCMFTLLAGQDCNVSTYFTLELIVMALMTPLLTMKSFSEERKLKTEQLLLTSPVTLPGYVGAKFLAYYTGFGGSFILSSVCFFPVMFKFLPKTTITGQLGLDYAGVTAHGGCIALILVGAAFISVGMLISSLTENQMISAIGTITVLGLLLGISFVNQYIAFEPVRIFFNWLSIYARFSNFGLGYFDIAALIYYASFAFVCLFVTVRIYEKRRWS